MSRCSVGRALAGIGDTSGRLRVVSLVEARPPFEFDDTAGPLAALAFDLLSGGRRRRGAERTVTCASTMWPLQGGSRACSPTHTGPVVSVDLGTGGRTSSPTGADGAAPGVDWQRQALRAPSGARPRA